MLIRVPKMLAAFASAIAGEEWRGNVELQKNFEDYLERFEIKNPSPYKTERDRGAGGSGGRTYVIMLYALGLFFYYRDSPKSKEEIHLTLAGQALVDQHDALPILRKQVLAFQYPSPYSINQNVRIDPKFRLRPFVLLLRLLTHEKLDGYLTDEEMAACVIGFATRDSNAEAEDIAARILRYRAEGIHSLDDDFVEKVSPGDTKSAPELINGKLKDAANTFSKWLQYTGFASAIPAEESGIAGLTGQRLISVLNEDLRSEIDHEIAKWSKPLIKLNIDENTNKFDAHRAASAFQRTYGVKAGMSKDTRKIGAIRQASTKDRITALVSGSLSHLFATQIVTKVTDELIEAVWKNTGIERNEVRRSLNSLIPSPEKGLNQFLDRYQQMAFSGKDEAINFELATASVLREVFHLQARQVGQGDSSLASRAVPDVEVWNEHWLGIIDTKAYASYDLPSDHQLRMQSNYIPKYMNGKNGAPLKFFLYISGGFSNSFSARLKSIITKSGIQGAGISMRPWLDLISKYPSSMIDDSQLLRLWSIGREITPQDIDELMNVGPGTKIDLIQESIRPKMDPHLGTQFQQTNP